MSSVKEMLLKYNFSSSVGQEVYGGSHRAARHDVNGGDLDLCVSELHGRPDLSSLRARSDHSRSPSRPWRRWRRRRQRLRQVQGDRAALPDAGVGDVRDVVRGAAVDVDDDLALARPGGRVAAPHRLPQGHRLVHAHEAVQDVRAPLAAILDEELVPGVPALHEAVQDADPVGQRAPSHSDLRRRERGRETRSDRVFMAVTCGEIHGL